MEPFETNLVIRHEVPGLNTLVLYLEENPHQTENDLVVSLTFGRAVEQVVGSIPGTQLLGPSTMRLSIKEGRLICTELRHRIAQEANGRITIVPVNVANGEKEEK